MDAVCTFSHPEYLMSVKHLLDNTSPLNSLWPKIQDSKQERKTCKQVLYTQPNPTDLSEYIELFCESCGLSMKKWLVAYSSKSLGQLEY